MVILVYSTHLKQDVVTLWVNHTCLTYNCLVCEN
jgi:hypothetical protein